MTVVMNRASRTAKSASKNVYTPLVSQYDRALIFAPPPRQTNAVKGFSRNMNDAQFVMARGAAAANVITDADVYDCEAGALTVGMNYNNGTPTNSSVKGLAFWHEKVAWDLGAGQSFLLQLHARTVGATVNTVLLGNSNGTWEGWGVVQNTNGTLSLNYRATGNENSQSFVLQRIRFDGTNMVTVPLALDAPLFLQVVVDGTTRAINAWINGEPCSINENPTGNSYGNGSTLLQAGSTIPAVKRNLGLGHIPLDTSFSPPTLPIRAVRFYALRIAVLPMGKSFRDPAMLDWRFNRRNDVLFMDVDYTIEG